MNSWPHFSPACRKDVDRILRSGRLTAYRANKQWGVGPQDWSQVYAFEREVERKFKVKHAVAVSSGTAAIHAALVSIGVRGKEVITSPYTFSATVAAIVHAGGLPRFADCDPHSFVLTPETVKPHVNKKTAAILPVHLFGYFPDLSGLLEIGLPVVEDACQSVGASRQKQFAGTVGLAGVYSFNGSKNVCAGEGGTLVTNSDEVAEKARAFINHSENFESEEVGLNYRMHELVAVLARHGLRGLDGRNERRRELAQVLWDSDLDEPDIHQPSWCGHKGCCRDTHAFYVYPFTVSGNRSRFIKRCAKRGLPVQAGYTTPLHKLKAFAKYQTRPLPVTEEVDRTLCLLTTLTPDRELSYARKVARIVREALE